MPRRMGMVLLSGGLDSTTVAAIAQRQGYELSALTLSYGQSHRREIEAARTIAQTLGLRHHVVDIEFYKRLAWYSALTQPDRFAIPTNRAITDMADEIPITYVPLRNTLFLTLAAALLESEALHTIEREDCQPSELEATLFIAANAIDYSGYPDCRPEYYRALSETLRLGSKLGTQYGVPLRIETPLLTLSKAEIVRLAVELGAPIQHTWSCYQGGPAPCGHCDSCLLRAKGFQEAGLSDPATPPT